MVSEQDISQKKNEVDFGFAAVGHRFVVVVT
jgi:hypothetical protein